jgi:8-oxo-dGTP pyrophosphatase MutT (NUDIX family)
MDYQVSAGLDLSELPGWLARAAKQFGTFPDGRVNYKNAPLAPAVMCVLKCGDEFLLAKRGYGLADANGVWSIINGFIDEVKPVAQIASQELREELGLELPAKQIRVAESLGVKGNGEKRAYIIFPCLATVETKPVIKLDREHTDFAWINRQQLENYQFLPDLPLIIDRALALK